MINEKNAENYIDRIKRLKNEKKITNEQHEKAPRGHQ